MAEKKRDIWDEHLREQLFTVLVWEFGPLKYWESKSRPFKSGGAFKEFLHKMSEHFNQRYGHDLSPDAIKSQINYVLQRPKEADYNVGHQDNFSRNIKAAVHARFISISDLKKRLSKQPGRDEQPGREQPGRDQQQAQHPVGDQQQRIPRRGMPEPVSARNMVK